MSRTFRNLVVSLILVSIAGVSAADQAQAKSRAGNQVDVVIALDVSGSMSGLIDSAKQRLWDIVNELGRAQPRPELRLAIVSFGRPSFGEQSGYVKIDLPFTSDLDKVNETLFAFGTDGGDEYVARAVSMSISELEWSNSPDALKILFVAGNEAATQDPQISVGAATRAATNAGVIVNTIYCGSENDDVASGWRDVAALTDGLYASIDQNSAAVANIATPMDRELAQLNQALNDTYIAYGVAGQGRRDNQLEQDVNAGSMSPAAMASRVVTKAGAMYDSSSWDLVDAIESGKRIEEIEAFELPEEMRAMSIDQRRKYILEQTRKRELLRAEISELANERREYAEAERASRAGKNDKGLDEAMQSGLRALAEKKGYTFE
jgi:hypothetical protein